MKGEIEYIMGHIWEAVRECKHKSDWVETGLKIKTMSKTQKTWGNYYLRKKCLTLNLSEKNCALL